MPNIGDVWLRCRREASPKRVQRSSGTTTVIMAAHSRSTSWSEKLVAALWNGPTRKPPSSPAPHAQGVTSTCRAEARDEVRTAAADEPMVVHETAPNANRI